MSTSNPATLPPFAQGRSLDNSRWYMGNVMTFLVTSEQTAGAFSDTLVNMAIAAPGGAAAGTIAKRINLAAATADAQTCHIGDGDHMLTQANIRPFSVDNQARSIGMSSTQMTSCRNRLMI